jgi:cobaltochelatase CobT
VANGEGLAVTLLCDNSGSMRGKSVISTAVWACLASELMDSLGVQHEILGFTTRSWKGGKCREEWLSNGKPGTPGRLCEIRHIVYKAFADSANDVMANCAVMLREGILKENIDGEALLWASERLLKHRVEKRLMFVISDGAPVDDSTLSTNSPTFLANHLKQVVSWIEANAEIDLHAIGIEFEANYYAKAQQVTAPRIGLPIIQQVVRTLVDRVGSEVG